MRLGFVLFILTVVLVDLGVHLYLWARFVRDPEWSRPTARLLTGLLVFAGALLPMTIVAIPIFGRSAVLGLIVLPLVWLSTVMFAVAILLPLDALRLASRLKPPPAQPDPGRRRFLARAGALVAAGNAGALGAVSLRSGLGEVGLVEVPVRLPRLPAALEGLTVVHLSDVHVGPTIGERFTRTIAERCRALRPDLVVITGDLVDGSVRELSSGVAPLAAIPSRFGTYFVTGNHEYYSGVEDWEAELARLGMRVLRNERVTIGDAGGLVDLAGVDDALAHTYARGHGTDLDRALAGRDPERELVLLAHQPRTLLAAEGRGVGLQLSGHTHGGQIAPMNLFVRFVQPYTAGLNRHPDGTQIYVSRGTGYWGPPMRLLAPAEITKVVLTRG